jgi:tyrosyl-tRNA synthetase
MSEALFSGNVKDLTVKDIDLLFKDAEKKELNEEMNLVDLLVNLSICSSKREAREFVSNNSISINGEKINDLEFTVKKENAIVDNFTIIRKGKKKYFVIKHM